MAFTPGLFDAPPPPPSPPPAADRAAWVEMSPAYFLSLSPAAQLSYCWQRDLDSAAEAEDDDMARFYLERAAGYRADMNALIGGAPIG